MAISEMRDKGNNESQDYIESLEELKNMKEQGFYSLNPRFLKISEKARGPLIEIADTPSREKDQAEALLEQVSKIISDCKDHCLKELLEIEMDGAATAHVLGRPNNYYNSP